jgi:MSHA type pilus biogenesis protein MshL
MPLRILGAILTALLLAACASPTATLTSTGHMRAENVVATAGTIPQTVQQSVSLPKPKIASKTETYSVVVNNVKVHDLLFALARDAKLNVDIHPGINGYVTLNAIDQTLPQLLSRISKQVDMRFELDGPNLAVMTDTPYLRTYKIDYVNMTRDTTGTVSVTTQIATAGSGGVTGTGGSSSGGAGSNNSVTKITNESKNHFWDNLIQNIKDILKETDKEVVTSRRSSSTQEQNNRQANTAATASGAGAVAAAGGQNVAAAAGSGNQAAQSQFGAQQQAQSERDFKDYQTVLAASVIAHPETGVITVRATSRQHEKVQEFFDRVSGSAQRQVLIEATVAEVTLDNNYQQGIDWSRVRTGALGLTLGMTGSALTSATAGVLALGFSSNKMTSMINFLETFGTVKVLSSPKISVINNQTAVLKVVDNVVYFTVKSDTNQNQTQTVKTYTTTPNVVPVGFVMNLTPQISDADTVLINVRPSISRVIGCAPDPNPDLAALAENLRCVPIIRSREMDSMLRIENGNIAVMGGLMEDEITKRDSGIPGLNQAPFLGALFTNKNDIIKKTELIIFLKPVIIKEASIQGDYSSARHLLPNDNFFADTPNPPSQLLPSGPRTGANP